MRSTCSGWQNSCKCLSLLEKNEPLLVDSVPIRGAGQQLDSYNLLAGAIRDAVRTLAKVLMRRGAAVATHLRLWAHLRCYFFNLCKGSRFFYNASCFSV